MVVTTYIVASRNAFAGKYCVAFITVENNVSLPWIKMKLYWSDILKASKQHFDHLAWKSQEQYLELLYPTYSSYTKAIEVFLLVKRPNNEQLKKI